MNSAVTALSALIVRLQGGVPEQSSRQPAKTDPVAAVAVRMTLVPPAKLALQVWPQLIPGRSLVTVPDPCLVTLIWYVLGGASEAVRLDGGTATTIWEGLAGGWLPEEEDEGGGVPPEP